MVIQMCSVIDACVGKICYWERDALLVWVRPQDAIIFSLFSNHDIIISCSFSSFKLFVSQSLSPCTHTHTPPPHRSLSTVDSRKRRHTSCSPSFSIHTSHWNQEVDSNHYPWDGLGPGFPKSWLQVSQLPWMLRLAVMTLENCSCSMKNGPTSSHLHQGSPGCGLVPVCGLLGTRLHSRRWVVGEWAKLHQPLPIAPHRLHYRLNHPPLSPCLWKNCLPWNGPQCQKGWGLLIYTVAFKSALKSS